MGWMGLRRGAAEMLLKEGWWCDYGLPIRTRLCARRVQRLAW